MRRIASSLNKLRDDRSLLRFCCGVASTIVETPRARQPLNFGREAPYTACACVFLRRRRSPPPRRRRARSQTATRLAPRSRASRRGPRGRGAPRAWPSGIYVGALSGPIGFGSKLCRSALRRVARRMRANSCTVGPRPRARQILRHWRRTGGYIWVRARKCGGQLEARFHFACVRHSGGGAASGLDQGLVTAYSAARRSHVFIARSHVAQCGRDGIVWLCFWPRGDPRASARNPSSRCAGVAGMTLPDLTRTFFFVF